MGLSMNSLLQGRKCGGGADGKLTGQGIAIRVRTGSTRLKETRPMTGIQFITDAQGRKTAAVIDLKKHRALWERSEEHTSELQSLRHLVCRLLLEKKKK